MDFASLPHYRKLEVLKNLHSLFNDAFYDNKLRSLSFDIASTNDFSGCYRLFKDARQPIIIIDSEIVYTVLPGLSETGQKEKLAIIMLHEIVHQYLHEFFGDPDGNHSITFYKEAIHHGLSYETQSYNVNSEELTEQAIQILRDFTF